MFLIVTSEGLNAGDSRDLGRLIHRFGGQPVGSFMQPPARLVVPSMAHALIFDQTHDNESPIQVIPSTKTSSSFNGSRTDL